MTIFKTTIAALAFSLTAAAVQAESWTLDPGLSNVTFASIKNNYTGENHSFGDVSGTVSETGVVNISLGLASVETNIDIRNERMIEHVFNAATKATVTAQIDMAELNDLAVGESTIIETYGDLAMIGAETELEAKLFVMRLSESKVMVTTDGMIMLSTEDTGVDAGIDVLQELAGLDSITRVSPVTMRLMFNLDGANG